MIGFLCKVMVPQCNFFSFLMVLSQGRKNKWESKDALQKLLGAIRKCSIFSVITVSRQFKSGKQKKGQAKNSKALNRKN